MNISPAILINKKCHSHRWFLVSKCEWLSQNCDPADAATTYGLLRSWGNARSKVNMETGLAPHSWGAYERNEFNEPRGLHLPIYRMLNSLTSYLIFNVQTPCSLCCKLVYSLTSPPSSPEQSSQRYWDAGSQAWSLNHTHQVK